MWKLFAKPQSGPKPAIEPGDTDIFHLQSVFNAMEDVVWILDSEQRILQANLATKTLFGLDPDNVTGHQCYNIVHNSSEPISECPILRMRKSLKRERMDMQVGEKWYQVTVDPLINSKQELEGAVHVIRDITEIRKSDKILDESLNRYTDLINNAPYGAHMYELQDSNRLVFMGANPAADKILGINHNQFIGMTIEEAFPPLIDTEIPEKYRRAASVGEHYSTEQISYSDDLGISGAFDVKAFQTRPNQMVAFFHDITEQKRYEEDLRKAKEKAEESDRLKSAFLANMSHEIRTPMNGIIGLSSMVEEPDIPEEEKRKFLRIIRENSFQLLHIINDLIDISKIEAGQVDLSENEICLNSLLDSLHEFYLPSAEKAEITLSLVKQADITTCCIRTDEVKVRQILENIISNALKFSRKGFVEVGYSIQPDFVRFWVRDSGIGISPEQKEIIFDRFRQAELSISQQYGGTGLGLSISKSYVESLGGKIWFESTPGVGTIFYFTIPYKPVGRDIRYDKQPEPVTRLSEGLTVLVVEDEIANFEYLEVVLRRLNISTLHAQTAQDAMDLFVQHPEINMVLMDVKLPDKNGYDVTREMLAVRGGIPIIAQTAYALSDEREKALSAGCIDYLSKPIKKESLHNLIGKYLS